jgi:hypothetical protein
VGKTIKGDTRITNSVPASSVVVNFLLIFIYFTENNLKKDSIKQIVSKKLEYQHRTVLEIPNPIFRVFVSPFMPEMNDAQNASEKHIHFYQLENK